jgi:hypothetical protein
MALVVEDGSIVDGANSYNTRAEIIAYALARKVTLPDSIDTDADAINAMDYLLRYDARWKGELVSPGVQDLAWPRACVKIGSYDFPKTEIPAGLKSAQAQLAIYSSQGIVLLPVSGAEAFVKREKLGPIETEYSETIALNSGNTPDFPAVDALLAGLIDGGGRLRSVRI